MGPIARPGTCSARKRTGRRDFLYVADCKLATTENMAYLHQHGGRFLSVLPRTRGEDTAFCGVVVAGRGGGRGDTPPPKTTVTGDSPTPFFSPGRPRTA